MTKPLDSTTESAEMSGKKKSEQEHRRYPRYNIDLGSFAVFRRDKSVRPGLITDISMG